VLRARLGKMTEYGFDFARLHSHFEAKSFFDAADEVGLGPGRIVALHRRSSASHHSC
jgi:hypothetical protein